MRITTPPPANASAINIKVDTFVSNTQGDQATLLAGLRNEFAALGYQIDSGDLILKAMITRLDRGSTIANVIIGLGVGSDEIDVRVEVSDAKGLSYMTFLVNGEAVDKRYSDMNGVVRGIAKQIATDVKRASR